MKITRRHFLAGTAAGTLMFGFNPLLAADPTEVPSPALTNPMRFDGRLFGFGASGHRYPGLSPEKAKRGTISLLTALDLKTGDVRQTPLEMGEGHAAMGCDEGRILCVAHHKNTSMLLDRDHKVIKTYTSPQGYVYGGHGLVFKSRNQFIMPMRVETPKTLADNGRFEVYDLKTGNKVDDVDSGGLHPHEIHHIPGKEEFAVTHYGDIYIEKAPLEHNAPYAKLTILDSKTLKPLRHYDQSNFNALLTHMRVSNDGWAYFVLTQYIKFNRLVLQPGEDPITKAVSEVERLYGIKYDFATPFQTTTEKHLAVPLPFVRVNTQTGEREIMKMDIRNTLRSQSVAYNKKMDQAFALYYHSDNLVVHTPNKPPSIITNKDLELKEIRGVTEIPGTPYLAVCGTFNGMSVMDLRDHKVVATYPTLNYNSTHLYHEFDL
jgi:hypothetical protein